MSDEDPIAALHGIAEGNRQTAAAMRETARIQRQGVEATLAANRALREMVQINLRCAARIEELCGPVQQMNRDVKHATATMHGVAASLQKQDRKLRSIITPAPVVVEEPATLSMTDDTVAFTPEADERIVRRILALEPEKPTFN